ncbi:MAG: pyruvate kinase [Myxococcota bacterium]|jgi:pyruvate kinase|nr:pyruvate kinase [Myxococcota bacterium]
MRRSKILCTLGPATADRETLRALVAAGLDAVRLNFSHGTIEEHARTVALVREVAAEAGVPLPVLQDLQGPKIRVGDLGEDGRELVVDEELLVAGTKAEAPAGALVITYPPLTREVGIGASLLLDDGLLRLEVIGRESPSLIRCRVVVGGHLASRKGVNLPGVPISAPALTPKDEVDLEAGLRMGVDWVALSFVRSAEDIRRLQERVHRAGAHTGIVAKIEKPEAVERLGEILELVDGIMVARGDLGVELSPQRVPLLQHRMVREANAAGKLVIVATQMLDSMVRNPRPTRAEVSDVAWAVMQGADATMLSNETAIGQYPVETVRMMAAIVDEVETHQEEGPTVSGAYIPDAGGPTSAMARAAVSAATDLAARAIVCFTGSGRTATLVSDYRPRQPVLALTPRPETYRRLGLCWGVTPVLVPDGPLDPGRALALARQTVAERGLAAPGDALVLTLSHPAGFDQHTNLVWVQRQDG